MAEYSYSVLDDFPNQSVDLEQLENEINDSSITAELVSSTVHDATCTIVFDAVLSGAEETTLDGIVAAHTGVGYDSPETVFEHSLSESSTTALTWQDKITLTTSANPPPGDYRLDWTFRYGASASNRKIEARVYNETADVIIETVIHAQVGADIRSIYTGFCICPVEGQTTLKLQYRVNDTGNPTAYISNARLLLGG